MFGKNLVAAFFTFLEPSLTDSQQAKKEGINFLHERVFSGTQLSEGRHLCATLVLELALAPNGPIAIQNNLDLIPIVPIASQNSSPTNLKTPIINKYKYKN